MEIINTHTHIRVDFIRQQMLPGGEIRCLIDSDDIKKEYPDMEFAILYVGGLSIVEVWNRDGTNKAFRVLLSQREISELI